jgi:hypothetical protein
MVGLWPAPVPFRNPPMKLLGITDLHGSRRALGRILDAAGGVDVVLLGGDISNFGSPDDVEALLHQARSTGAEVLAVAGNCDSAAIDGRLAELRASLHGRGVVLGGVGLHGLSGMPPWLPTMYQFTERELAEFLAAGHRAIGDARPHVVLSHPPPRNEALDRTASGANVGSTALRAFVDEHQPTLVVCGHIHEGRGVETLGRTKVVNCGLAAAGQYALVELAEIGEEVAVMLHVA